MRRYFIIPIFFISAIKVTVGAESPHSHSQAQRNNILNELFSKTGITEPKDPELNEKLHCKFKETFDPKGDLFTTTDLSYSALEKCFDDFCKADKTSFETFRRKAIQRIKLKIKWLEEHGNEPVNLKSNDDYPTGGKWLTVATSKKELENRWQKELTYNLSCVLIKSGIPKRPKELERLQTTVVATLSETLKNDLSFWEQLTDLAKDDVMEEARITCYDPYAKFVIKGATDGNTAHSFPGFLAILTGEKGKEGIKVVQTIPGSAARDRLKPGDIVTQIQHQGDAFFLTNPAGVKLFLEAEKTPTDKLTLTVKRGSMEFQVKLNYDVPIPDTSVVLSKDMEVKGAKIRVVQIPDFNDFTGDTQNATPSALPRFSTSNQVFESLLAPGEFQAVVLDLRGNPGGEVVSALDTAALFLSDGKSPIPLVNRYHQDSGKFKRETLMTQVPQHDRLTQTPLFVLVDRGSASSAEILTNALKDSNRAVVIGDTTFGKGIGQRYVPLNEDLSLAITDSLFSLDTHQKGVTPHIRIPSLAGALRDQETAKIPEEKMLQFRLLDAFEPKKSQAPLSKKFWMPNQEIVMEMQRKMKTQLQTPDWQKYLNALKEIEKFQQLPSFSLSLSALVAQNREFATHLGKVHAMEGNKGPKAGFFSMPQPHTQFLYEIIADYLKTEKAQSR